jgi:hypothetical protein
MANQSIKSAFERLWYHIVLKLKDYVKTETFDEHIADTSNPHNITLEDFGITVTPEEINHIDGTTSNIQEQLSEFSTKEYVDASIDALPIEIAEDGYTDVTGLRHMTNLSSVLNGNTLTITQTLEGDIEFTDTIQFDENGMPSSGVSDGISWTMDWTGFEVAPTLPPCTEDDNGKILQVVDGEWAATVSKGNDTMAGSESSNYLSMQMEVNQVSTSRRVQRYLAKDLSNDAFIRINGEAMEYVVGETDGTTEQAYTPEGQPLYWDKDISSATIGNNGYPYINNDRVFATTTETIWPVMVFKYTEQVLRSTHFIDDDGTFTVDSFGSKDANGNQWGYIAHNGDGVKFVVQDANGNDLGLIMRYDGFMDLFGMRRTTLIDFSEVPFGKLYEMVDGVESEYSWTIERDDKGRVVKVIDDLDGHETQVRWWTDSE